MSWQDQGRQEHGYFGSGTGSEKQTDTGASALFAPNARTQRMTAAIDASVAVLPAKSRNSPFTKLSGEAVKGLADTMTKWSRAGALSDAEFAAAFFDRNGDDPTVKLLRQAAETAAAARSHEDLRNASTLLAKAGQQVGLDRWPGFIDATIKLGTPFAASAQAKSGSAIGAPVGTGRTTQADVPANGGSEPAHRQAVQGSGPKTPGVEVRLPNGQTIPNEFSPTGTLMSPVADLSAVATAGRDAGSAYLTLLNHPDTALGAVPFLLTALGTNVGQGGKFDYQRQGNHLTGFTQLPQFRDVSNVNVGLFCQQAGLTLNETLKVAGAYARVFSGNAAKDKPNGLNSRNAQFITTGFEFGRSGVFGLPVAR